MWTEEAIFASSTRTLCVWTSNILDRGFIRSDSWILLCSVLLRQGHFIKFLIIIIKVLVIEGNLIVVNRKNLTPPFSGSSGLPPVNSLFTRTYLIWKNVSMGCYSVCQMSKYKLIFWPIYDISLCDLLPSLADERGYNSFSIRGCCSVLAQCKLNFVSAFLQGSQPLIYVAHYLFFFFGEIPKHKHLPSVG